MCVVAAVLYAVARLTMKLLTNRRFSVVCVSTPKYVVAFTFLETSVLRARNFDSHLLFLKAVLGARDGVRIVLLSCLTLAQTASSLALVVPSLRRRLGTEATCASLAVTLAVEVLLYKGLDDTNVLFYAMVVYVNLAGIVLYCRDCRARQLWAGIPISDRLLAIDSAIRSACTHTHSALLCVPLALILLVHALLHHRYWNRRGAAYEIHRLQFMTNLSMISILAIIAAHDKAGLDVERMSSAALEAKRLCFVKMDQLKARLVCRRKTPREENCKKI